MQHQIAIVVREYLAEARTTQGHLAEDLGWRRERLARLLGGQAVMSFQDAALLLSACGQSLLTVAWQSADPDERPLIEFEVLQTYLQRQLGLVEERISGTAQARPST